MEQALETQPLLGPETTPVVHALLHLVAYTGGFKFQIEISCSKNHVPPGEQHAEIVPPKGLFTV